MARFFTDKSYSIGDVAVLTGDVLGHLRVLRPRIGELITLCTGGTDYTCSLTSVDKAQALLKVESTKACEAEPSVLCSVYIAHAKSDKIEHVIMKAVELGAWEIVVYPSKRCVSKPDAQSMPSKLGRWEKISQSAAQQSGRGIIPAVKAETSFRAAMTKAALSDTALFLYENEKNLSISSALNLGPYRTISLVSGPEGGFEADEADYAGSLGMSVVTLGPRILRCETAPLAALSCVMLHSGNF